MVKTTRKWIGWLLVLVLFAAPQTAWGQSQKGTLRITGVPADVSAGRYDRDAGVFYADVSEISDALITFIYDDVEIAGKTMEWRTDDDYLIFTVAAKLTQEDFELTADRIQYFGEENRLSAEGQVVVVTDDATVYAHRLDYDEETDEALFTGSVRVVFSDGIMTGERMLMLLEKSELQFFGSFQGEFSEEDNNEE